MLITSSNRILRNDVSFASKRTKERSGAATFRLELTLPIWTNMKNVADEKIFPVETTWCARHGPFIFYQPPYQFLNHECAIFQQPSFSCIYIYIFHFSSPVLSSPKHGLKRALFPDAFLCSWIYKVNIFWDVCFQDPTKLKFINH